jgi:DNA-binding CsgD family transcriptional regulator
VLAATAARDLVRAGDWDAAHELLTSFDADDAAAPEARLVLARLAALRGDWDVAQARLEGVASGAGLPLERGWAAYASLVAVEAACWRRRSIEARDAVRRGIEIAAVEGERDTLLDLAALGIRVEADAVESGARRRQGVVSATRELATEHWIRLQAIVSGDASSSTARDRAILAKAEAELVRLTLGRRPRSRDTGAPDGPAEAATWAGAAAAWSGAVGAWDAVGNPYEAAYCRWRLAETLVVGRLDREAARTALRDAVTVAGRLSAEPLAREAEALARRARLSEVGRSRSAQTGSGQAGLGLATGFARARELGLSERETAVLGLIAVGLTDREIGERLFITTKTVGHHVSHILAKLALERRGEAAALAFRIGLVEPHG